MELGWADLASAFSAHTPSSQSAQLLIQTWLAMGRVGRRHLQRAPRSQHPRLFSSCLHSTWTLQPCFRPCTPCVRTESLILSYSPLPINPNFLFWCLAARNHRAKSAPLLAAQKALPHLIQQWWHRSKGKQGNAEAGKRKTPASVCGLLVELVSV